MKVLLIKPGLPPNTIGHDFHRTEPLELEYLAAAIKDRHSPRILDLRIGKRKLLSTLRAFNPDVVGVTGYTQHINIIKNICLKVKQYNPAILTVVGGHHATVAPEDFSDAHIDLTVVGDGIKTLPELLDAWEKKTGFTQVKGLAFLQDGKFYKTESRPVSGIDEFPIPARSYTNVYRKDYYMDWLQPIASMHTSRGCPFRCNFCSLWKITDKIYQQKKPEAIVEELRTIKEKYVFFTDDETFYNHKRMMEVANRIEQAGIKKSYFCYVRSDTITGHPELIKKWRDIGLKRLFIGLEFINDKDMEAVNKKNTAANNEQAIKICQELGIDIFASFLVHPDFTEKDFNDMVAYIKKMKIDYSLFGVLTPLKGSNYYEEVKNQITDYNFDLIDFYHTVLSTRLPLITFYRNLFMLYRKTFSLTTFIGRLPRYPLARLHKVLIQYSRTFFHMGKMHLDHKAR